MTTPSKIVTHSIKSFTPAMQTTVGDFGIEFEAESLRRWDVMPPGGWVSKADNSLRHHGIEFVTRGALTHANLAESVGRMCEVINRNDPLQDSPRTSVHVHINMQDRTPMQIASFDIAYFVFEDFFLNLCAPHRKTTPFAVTVKAAPGYIRDLDGVISRSERDMSNFTKFWHPNNHKYTALNMCRLNDLGTVEQRSMHGNYDAAAVTAWCSLLYNLRTFTEKFDTPIEMCDYIYLHGPDTVLEEITPDGRTLEKMYGNTTYQDRVESCEDALSSVSRVAYSRTPDRWKALHQSVMKGFFLKKPPSYRLNVQADAFPDVAEQARVLFDNIRMLDGMRPNVPIPPAADDQF